MLVFAFVGLEKADDVLLYLFQLIICTTKKENTICLFCLFLSPIFATSQQADRWPNKMGFVC